jgi:hypothetical protein
LAGKKIDADAKTSGLQLTSGQLETETFVESGGRVGPGRQKIGRSRRSGKVLARAVEWSEDEAG